MTTRRNAGLLVPWRIEITRISGERVTFIAHTHSEALSFAYSTASTIGGVHAKIWKVKGV